MKSIFRNIDIKIRREGKTKIAGVGMAVIGDVATLFRVITLIVKREKCES